MSMVPVIRWGILATGRIAADFAQDLRHVHGSVVSAVGSRSEDAAGAFAARHAGPDCRVHGSYEALVADPDVDVVYVASPHTLHHAHARLALEAGKPVLCEKPLAMNVAEAEDLIALATERGLFFMEAMWSACHPVLRVLRDQVAEGRFGTPKQLHADFSWVVEAPAHDRLLDPALGAGAVLDLGIYPLTLAELLMGPTTSVAATGGLAPSGIDLDVAIALRHQDGGVSALTCSMAAAGPCSASLATDQGLVDVPAPFHHPPYAVFVPADGGAPQRIEAAEPLLGIGLGNEAAEVARCLRLGLTESPLVPHAQTLSVLRTMDEVRRQLGVRYAADG